MFGRDLLGIGFNIVNRYSGESAGRVGSAWKSYHDERRGKYYLHSPDAPPSTQWAKDLFNVIVVQNAGGQLGFQKRGEAAIRVLSHPIDHPQDIS